MQLKTASIIIPNNNFLQASLNLEYDICKVTNSLKSLNFEVKKVSIIEENENNLARELISLTKVCDIIIVVRNSNSFCVSNALAQITSQEVKFDRFKNCEGKIISSWPEYVKTLKGKEPVRFFQRIFVLVLGIPEDQLCSLENYLKQYRKEDSYSKVFILPSNGYQHNFQDFSGSTFNITLKKENDTVKYLLTSKSFENVVKGELLLREKLGSNIQGVYWLNDMIDLIYKCDDKHIKLALEVIERSIDKFGLDNLFLSFNGGKDCTVLLHLVETVIAAKFPEKKNSKLFCLYVRSENAFKEQDEFIQQCVVYFNLEVISINLNIKESLGRILKSKPNLKGCLMGTRRTDPYSSHLHSFEMTDPDWPQVMRISPLLDWHYSDIWDYLLYYKVPYCKLYDYGYTSLGNATNTVRNPSLLYFDGEKEVYLPAYKMLDEKCERSGRNVSKM